MAAVPTEMGVNVVEKKETHSDTMTISDIKDKFKKDFLDEIHDSNTYYKMAITAEMEGHYKLAEGLYEMAYDEYTHAYFIHENLESWNCEISEKEMMMWHELKERVHQKFRD